MGILKKAIFVLAFLVTSSAYAGGSWKITCTSDQGVSFYSDNGMSEIQFTSLDKNGSIIKSAQNVDIENYEIGTEKSAVSVKWFGPQKVMSERYENSCNSDQIQTSFEQKVEIKAAQKKAVIVDVVCREEIITSASAVLDECSK